MNIIRMIILLVFASPMMAPSAYAKQDNDASLIRTYLSIAEALASDSFSDATKNASVLRDLANKNKDKKKSDKYQEIAADAAVLSQATSLKDARMAFKGLSEKMKVLVEDEKDSTVDVMYCPMMKAPWLQEKGKSTQNPYYGKSMLSCGYPVKAKSK